MAALRSFKRIPGPLQLLLLLLLLLPWDLVVTGQNLEVTQLPETISVKAGEGLTLNCTLTGGNLPGGVRWYKGLERNQTPIYSNKEGASNRAVRVIPGSDTDFSINIQNIRPEDAGTYYCVKFRAGVPERELASGNGTLVSVIVPPKVRLETNPPSPVQLNVSVTVTCNAESFYPANATVSLFAKDAPSRKGTVAPLILNPDGTFSLQSNLEVMATKDKNSSVFLCQVRHDSQSLVNETTTLFIATQLERSSSPQLSPSVLYIGLFLSKIAAILFISFF